MVEFTLIKTVRVAIARIQGDSKLAVLARATRLCAPGAPG